MEKQELQQMIGQGNTAEIYRLDDNKILKLFRNGLHKGIIEREYQNSLYVQDILACVPKVYELVEIEGRYGIVYQEVIGIDMLKIMTKNIWKINQYAKDLAKYHLFIQLPIKGAFTSVKEKLEEDIKHVEILSEETKGIIYKYLKQLPDNDYLCHFDFHPGNIMLVNQKPVFLDWMTACRGDVCADVARTCIMLKHGEAAHVPWLMRKTISMFQRHIYKVYIAEYLKISNKSKEDVMRWELPVAAARLREWISEDEKQVLLQLVNQYCNNIVKNGSLA